MTTISTINTGNEKCATCGHERRAHIYDEGACRPGFVCEERCDRFTEPVPAAPEPSFQITEPGRYVLANGDSVNLEKISAHLWTALMWDEGAKSMLRHRWVTSGRNVTGNTSASRDKLQVIARFPEPRDLRADIRTLDAVAQIRENEVLKQIDEAKKAYSSGLARRQAEATREDQIFQAAIHLMRRSLDGAQDADQRAARAVYEAEKLVAEIEKTRERRKVLFK